MADCTYVTAEGGLSSNEPCGGYPACLPWHVTAWNASARSWVEAVEAVAVAPAELAFAAELRSRFRVLDLDVPSPWALSQRVGDYILIAQHASCGLASKVAPPPPPPPTGPTTPEPSWWEEWAPSLPSLPSWPSLPSLPSLPSWSWPTIPPWVWYAGGAVLLLWLWSKSEGRDRR